MSNFGDLNVISLHSINRSKRVAKLQIGSSKRLIPCAIGRQGQTILKKEGDGKTPIGKWQPQKIYYRQDRIGRPISKLPINVIKKQYGWCDAPNDRNYNRPVTLPYKASTECLWRDDELYDLILVLNHNQTPRIKGKGSAIFIHVAKPGFPPTEGCIAIEKQALLRLLTYLDPLTKIII